jgi:hypothetical protein
MLVNGAAKLYSKIAKDLVAVTNMILTPHDPHYHYYYRLMNNKNQQHIITLACPKPSEKAKQNLGRNAALENNDRIFPIQNLKINEIFLFFLDKFT